MQQPQRKGVSSSYQGSLTGLVWVTGPLLWPATGMGLVLCIPGRSQKPGSVAPPDTRAETSSSAEEGSQTVCGGDCFEESAHHLHCKFLLLQIKETMRVNIWPHVHTSLQGFPGDSAVKNPPAMQETQEMWVQSLGQENPLEEDMETHSSILGWKIPGTEEPGGLQFIGF